VTDGERLAALRQHVTEQLDYLKRFFYHHECNIPEPTEDDYYDYVLAQGEQKALLALLLGLYDAGLNAASLHARR
jgi:aspartokinase